MPGNPKECRLHALRCAELAASARTPELKATLLGISANWQKLAVYLEHTQILLADAAAESPFPPDATIQATALA